MVRSAQASRDHPTPTQGPARLGRPPEPGSFASLPTNNMNPAGSVTRYEYGKRPDGKLNEVRVREKTRREAEVRAHPGPAVWAAWPLRGNQEAPSQAGGHARCSSRETAFVRAPWVGPPNRASPMRALVIVLEPRGADTWVVSPGVVSRCRQTGLRPCVGSWSLSERVEWCVSV
jgi:hypothetical protein